MTKAGLANKTIILTHPISGNSDEFCKLFSNNGSKVYHFPMISIESISLPDSILKDLNQFDTIIFTSKNGVKNFFINDDITNFIKQSRIEIICIGEKTSESLKSISLEADFIPSSFNSYQLLSEIKGKVNFKHKKILLILGQLAPNIIMDELFKDNTVKRLDVYKTIIADEINKELKDLLCNKKIDYSVFTSPSCFEGYIRNYKAYLTDDTKLVSIGKTTSKRMESLGYPSFITAQESTYNGIYKSIIKNI